MVDFKLYFGLKLDLISAQFKLKNATFKLNLGSNKAQNAAFSFISSSNEVKTGVTHVN